ncbi:MAG: hypothetical protein RJS97_08740 [Parvibaculaceae bacterium]
MDALYEFDPKRRHLVIDSSTEVGLDLNKLFTGLLQREYGNDHFAVVRQPQNMQTAGAPST